MTHQEFLNQLERDGYKPQKNGLTDLLWYDGELIVGLDEGENTARFFYSSRPNTLTIERQLEVRELAIQQGYEIQDTGLKKALTNLEAQVEKLRELLGQTTSPPKPQ